MANLDFDPWTVCKLANLNRNGKLILLRDNIKKLVQYFEQGTQDIGKTPIAILSFVGETSSGKSFYTNLIAEYLEHKGRSWTKNIKMNGVKGFSYGSKDNFVNSENFPAQDEDCGVYCWPKLFLWERHVEPKFVWLFHVQHPKPMTENAKFVETELNDPLNMFMALVSSRIGEIVWNKESVMAALYHAYEKSDPVKQQLCRSVLYILRCDPGKIDNSKNFEEATCILNATDPLHDMNGAIKIPPPQERAIQKAFTQIFDETILTTAHFDDKKLSVCLIEDYLDHCVNLVNEFFGGRTQKTPNSGKSRQENRPMENVTPECQIPRALEKVTLKDEIAIPETPEAMVDPPSIKNNSHKIIDSNEVGGLDKARSEVQLEPPLEIKDNVNARRDELAVALKNFLARRNWEKLKRRLRDWMKSELTRKNVRSLETLFEKFSSEIIQREINGLKKKGAKSIDFAKKFEEIAKQEISEKYKPDFIQIENTLQQSCEWADTQFQQHVFFCTEDFQRNLEMTQEKIKSCHENADIIEMTSIGFQKLIPHYQSINEMALQNEKNISSECRQTLQTFYVEEMEAIFKSGNKLHAPKDLVQVHIMLVSHLKQAFQKSIKRNISSKMDELEAQLDARFAEFQRNNMEIIGRAQKRINNMIFKYKSNYEIKLQAILDDNPDGLNENGFCRKSQEATAEVKKEFLKDLSNDTCNGTGEKYMLTLEHYMDESRGGFQEENKLNRKAAENKIKPSIQQETSKSVQGIYMQTNLETPKESEYKGKILCPLLFQLTSKNIYVGIISEDHVVDAIEVQPAEICLTRSNEWKYGKQVAAFGFDQLWKNHWDLGTLLMTTFSDNNEGIPNIITIYDTEITITKEFLLGLFFRLAKQDIEKNQGGEAPEVMVSVPFWFSSSQRQGVIDSCRIAGFSKFQLFNENSAAAYFMSNLMEYDAKFNTLIISENCQKIDISLYTYDHYLNKLSILGHFGDYEADLSSCSDSSWFIIGIVKSFISAIKNARQSQQQIEEEKAVKRLKDLWDYVVNQGRKQHFSAVTVVEKILICCESEVVPLLQQLARKITPVELTLINKYAAMHGMAKIYETLSNRVLVREKIIPDGMPFYLKFRASKKEECVLLKKADTFLATDNRRSIRRSFPASLGTFEIFEINSSGEYPILEIKINHLAKSAKNMEVHLERSADGIFKLTNVHFTSLSNKSCNPSSSQWIHRKSGNLTEHQIAKYISVMTTHFKKNSNIERDRKLLVKKGEKILKAIENGHGVFKNSIMKALVTRQVNETVETLKTSKNISENEIKKQSDLMGGITLKYMINIDNH